MPICEIFHLELSPDLIVASACMTWLSKLLHGEGIMGLMLAFFYTGAPSICVSLWSVDDESTTALMVKFYKHPIEGELDKAEVFRQIKLELTKCSVS